MIPTELQPVANHLWQSTLFAAVAGLMTLALRDNRAQARYWLWLAASVKFLIPFSLLVDVGSHFGRRTVSAVVSPGVSSVIEQVSQPFAAPTGIAPVQMATEPPFANWIPAVLYAIWAIGFATLVFSWRRRWQGLQEALRTASPLDLPIGIETMTSPSLAEPGVFGIRRPVLLLPAGITERLTAPQLEAILAHEMCHVRRRDNLTTAIHMGVEAVFWFHPLVWWLGSRLMEERERACDEEVLLTGAEPQAYAEGILKICELYLESPLPCVSGVTGANLKRRIEEIMSNRVGRRLSLAKKTALATAGAVALAAPLVMGIMNAPVIRAQSATAARQKFEVASIKPCKDATVIRGGGRGGSSSPSSLNLNCQTVKNLILTAYAAYANGHISPPPLPPVEGGPAWIDSDRYSINAKPEGNPSGGLMRGPMLQALLEERFQLKIRRVTREVPAFALTTARNGPKLTPYQDGDCIDIGIVTPLRSAPPPPPATGERPVLCGANIGKRTGQTMKWDVRGVSLDFFARAFLGVALERPVINKTGMRGLYNIHLEFALDGLHPDPSARAGDPDGGPPLAPSDPAGPSIFSAVQQQLGLKLESTKGPGEFLVIDHVERPSEN